jgi:S1-C subfamily serine protease
MQGVFNHFGLRASVAGAALIAAATVFGGVASAAPTGVAALVDPAVVDVNTTLGYEDGAAAGTGIVLTSTGEILTNNHVIRGATNIKVTDVGNGKTYPATVVGYDVASDIAVLQLKGASGLTTISLGSSASVKVGQAVTAIGNAGGVAGTPSVAPGTVTGLGKSITASDDDGTVEQLTHLIETNAGLEPGDSGGPLVNSSGLVVGIDTAASAGFSFQDVSGATQAYAIPINHALALAKQILAGHASATTHIGASPLLGVDVQTAQEDNYGYGGGFGFGYSGGYNDAPAATGAIIAQVLPGSPAAGAGLAEGDVITAISGKKITTPTTLTNALLRYSPGSSVTVTWVDQSGVSDHASVKLATGAAQ